MKRKVLIVNSVDDGITQNRIELLNVSPLTTDFELFHAYAARKLNQDVTQRHDEVPELVGVIVAFTQDGGICEIRGAARSGGARWQRPGRGGGAAAGLV